MKKLLLLLCALLTGVGASAKTVTTYSVSGRATTLETGKKYMIRNTAVRTFLYGTESGYGTAVNAEPLSFSTTDNAYLWTLAEGTETGTYTIKNVGTGLYSAGGTSMGTEAVDYTIADFSTCPSKGGMASYNDDGTQTAAADITAENHAVYVVQYGTGEYWNHVSDAFGVFSKAHVYVLYEVTEGTAEVSDTQGKQITNLSDLTNNKVYRIIPFDTKRGALYAKPGEGYVSQCGGVANYGYGTKNADVALDYADESQQWGIISYEEKLYLYSVGEKKFAAWTSGTYVPLSSTPDNYITLSEASTEGYFIIKFGGTQYINIATGWTYGAVCNWNGEDGGNQMAIIEAADFDDTDVVAMLENYFHPSATVTYNELIATLESMQFGSEIGLYSLTGDYAGYTSQAATIIDGLKKQGYTADNMTIAQGLLASAVLNTPAAGLYRLKNVATGEYLVASSYTAWNSTVAGVYANGDAASAATVIRIVEVDGVNYMYNQGAVFNWVVANAEAGGGTAWIAQSPDKYVHWFPGNKAGQIAFALCYGNGSGDYASYLLKGIYTTDATGAVIGGTDYTADAAQWIVEKAENVSVTLNDGGDGNYYATVSVPFDFTVEGAKAYTLARNNTWLVPTEAETVAAGTPVLLKGTSAEATLTIGSEYATAPATDTALKGNYLATAIDGDTDYVLGKVDNVVGFYHWEGTTLAANRAYVVGETGVKGYAIDFGQTDAIEAVAEAQAGNGAIYNLAGQRVGKAVKGIYVIQGKKVVVK